MQDKNYLEALQDENLEPPPKMESNQTQLRTSKRDNLAMGTVKLRFRPIYSISFRLGTVRISNMLAYSRFGSRIYR